MQNLLQLQGSVLPRLLGAGRQPLGFGYLVLSLVRGTPLSKLSRITPQVATSAEAALLQVGVKRTRRKADWCSALCSALCKGIPAVSHTHITREVAASAEVALLLIGVRDTRHTGLKEWAY